MKGVESGQHTLTLCPCLAVPSPCGRVFLRTALPRCVCEMAFLLTTSQESQFSCLSLLLLLINLS